MPPSPPQDALASKSHPSPLHPLAQNEGTGRVDDVHAGRFPLARIVTFVPSAFMMPMLSAQIVPSAGQAPSYGLTKAIRVPSGDHAGSKATGASCVNPVPSVFITAMWRFENGDALENAIFEPSGENAGP